MAKDDKRGPGRPALGASTSVKPATGHRKRIASLAKKRTKRLGYSSPTDVVRLAVVNGLNLVEEAPDHYLRYTAVPTSVDESSSTIRLAPPHKRRLDALARRIIKAGRKPATKGSDPNERDHVLTRGDVIRLVMEVGLLELEEEEA